MPPSDTAPTPATPRLFHVAMHEAGHVLVFKAALGEAPPARPVDLHTHEPQAWDDVFHSLMSRDPPPDATRVTAFLLGGVEALLNAALTGDAVSSRFHGLHGPDGSNCDAELIDAAVMRHGADRWRASDLARLAVRRDWPAVMETARRIFDAGRIDPEALEPILRDVRPV